MLRRFPSAENPALTGILRELCEWMRSVTLEATAEVDIRLGSLQNPSHFLYSHLLTNADGYIALDPCLLQMRSCRRTPITTCEPHQ